jgi:hypothetical protein
MVCCLFRKVHLPPDGESGTIHHQNFFIAPLTSPGLTVLRCAKRPRATQMCVQGHAALLALTARTGKVRQQARDHLCAMLRLQCPAVAWQVSCSGSKPRYGVCIDEVTLVCDSDVGREVQCPDSAVHADCHVEIPPAHQLVPLSGALGTASCHHADTTCSRHRPPSCVGIG